ncbi:amino acid adenylation domain-containing protein [Paralcaligenes sp. KSB-10]|uniref:non-ribosomal peptide synthetase n=1 Tax=Paralcaligenes sp. KSB-10 TaxID=2901142 RepID=UPI001E4AB12D|nr:non-ribosomal peptide synthetase [Paralcaligenes sp. KSB-10]UHL63937.1 amino acid adenylation domain-containing protein [Paralcaligenes sp. KSB-10]
MSENSSSNPPDLLHRMFEAMAGRMPQAVALISGNTQVTYAELDAMANGIAHDIHRRLGDAPASQATHAPLIVGLHLARSIEAVAAMLGIMKAGAAWVSLDPAYPMDRLEFMLKDTAAPIVCAVGKQASSSGLGGRTDAQWIDVAQVSPSTNPLRSVTADPADPVAYVVYTSGSTGTPKGVLGTHRSMLSRFVWMWESYPFNAQELACLKTSLNFVDSVWETFGGLLQGIPGVLVDDATAHDPQALLSLLAESQATRLVAVPSLLGALFEAHAQTDVDLPSLRYLTSSGEALTGKLAGQAAQLAPNAVLLNLYGSSEMAADATCSEIERSEQEEEVASIGRPIGRMKVHVLNDKLEPVNAGEPGELHVSGPGLALGYLRRPDLTAQKFIANPFNHSADPEHAKLFRSGDIVRQEVDGTLHYLGRSDFQIKIRGVRIEPGEVETALAKHPAIRACAVAGLDGAAGKQLVAFYETRPGTEPAAVIASELRSFLSQSLAAYMVPSRFIHIEQLPQLPNGKLDRNGLRLPQFSAVEDAVQVGRTPTETVLLAIWKEVLGHGSIDIDDDFFAVGGDSILVARVCTKSRLAGFFLSPRDLYQHPILSALARHAENARTAKSTDTKTPQGTLPLSPMQRYYFSWAKPNPNKFNVGFIARCGHVLDIPTLQSALRRVIQQHDAIRLRFEPDAQGNYTQHFASSDDVYTIPVDHFTVPDADAPTRLAFIDTKVQQLHDSLDIARGPVIRAAFFEDPASLDHHFFFTMHELVSDAISLQVTLEDLRTAYTALSEGREPAFPHKTTPFHTWVEGVIDYARQGQAAQQLDYWLEQARDTAEFPEDAPNAAALQSDIQAHAFQVLDQAQVSQARQHWGGIFQATLVHAIVAALAITAHRISGQKSLIFHKVAHGRETCIPEMDVSRTVGWFITHTPITVRLESALTDQGLSPARALSSVLEQYRAIPDNGLGHSALRYFSDDPRARELARHDQVKTLFQYIGDVWEDNYDGSLFLPPDPALMDLPDTVAAQNLADYHLHVYAYLMDGCFRMKFFYTRPNYRPDTIQAMAELFSDAIKSMLLGPG